MIFRLLLILLGWGLKTVILIAGFRSPAFKERLAEKEFLLQIRTRDKALNKSYRFTNGGVSLKKESSAQPDFLIEWSDCATASRSIFKYHLAARIEAVSAALLADKLSLEYEVAPTFWLATTLKDLPLAVLKGE